MPYINLEQRALFDKQVEELKKTIKTLEETKRDGALNYIFTRLLDSFDKENYFTYSRKVSVLECCKL